MKRRYDTKRDFYESHTASQYIHDQRPDCTYIFSFQSCIVAVVVPDVDVIKCWALENGIQGTFSALCENPKVKKMILDDMLQFGKTAGLKNFEQVCCY